MQERRLERERERERPPPRSVDSTIDGGTRRDKANAGGEERG